MMPDSTEEAAGFDPGFRDRLADVVKQLGGDPQAAKVADVHRQTIYDWKRGKGRIPLAAAVSLTRAADRSLEWLVYGAEPGMPDAPDAEQIVQIGGALSIERDGTTAPDGFVLVPMLQVQASAGPGRLVGPGEGQDGVIALQEQWLRGIGLIPSRTEALTVSGDSMDPTIRDGDVLLVDRSIDSITNQGIYVLVLNDMVLVKRVLIRLDRRIVLKSDNHLYGEEVVSKDDATRLTVLGRVKLCARTM